MLKSTYRWCLTGTPIENKLEDLFSLVHFLNLETFGEWFWWNSYINVNGNKDSSSSFELLRQILKPVLLRRTKESTDKEGKDIIQLPKKNIYIEKVQLNKNEKKLYGLLHSKSKSLFEEFNKDKEIKNSYIHIF